MKFEVNMAKDVYDEFGNRTDILKKTVPVNADHCCGAIMNAIAKNNGWISISCKCLEKVKQPTIVAETKYEKEALLKLKQMQAEQAKNEHADEKK